MTTPLRRQYLEIKKRYPHAILFFRLGDFYETFDEDAETVARELEITLTSRPVSKGQRVPLAGIPHHALDAYLGKLISKGYKVAVCEQVEEPAKGKKLVERQVVRVVSPGTLVEDNLLQRGANNYLAALLEQDGVCGIAHVDVSTGEFGCLQVSADGAGRELERLRPSELLLPQGASPPAGLIATLTPLRQETFEEHAATSLLLSHFESAGLEGLGLAGMSPAARAAGAVIAYLQENQRAVLGHVARILCYRPGRFMTLDANTSRNLELFEPLRPESEGTTVLGALDQTKTAMGQRLLRRWLGQPLLDPAEIAERQEGVQFFFDSAVRRERAGTILGKMPDLERTLGRVSAAAAGSSPSTLPRDLVALRRGLELVPPLRDLLAEDAPESQRKTLEGILAELHPCREVAELIAASISDDPQGGNVIRPGFSEELDGLRSLARDARQYLADLERRERERTGIKSLKVGYNKVFGYYIEVSNANKDLAPADYQRRRTTSVCRRW